MASGKVTFSISMTKVTALPPLLHPKQWKKPFVALTLKEGVFSLWNGQHPM